MVYTFKLLQDRCRVTHKDDGRTWLDVVYVLNQRVPSGLRKVLVPALDKALAKQDLSLVALDLFDEFIRMSVPLETPAALVEKTLKDVLGAIKPTEPPAASKEAQQALKRYTAEATK